MSLPDKIQIQIIDRRGEANALSNIFFGLKIFKDDGSWYTYSFIKTDLQGSIKLTKQQVIENTEIQHYLADFNSNSPTEVEIYVWDSKLINEVVLAAKRIADIYKDKNLLSQQLQKEGFAKEQIPGMIESFSTQPDKDTKLYEFLKDVKNSDVRVYTKKVRDKWMDGTPKYYEFIVESE